MYQTETKLKSQIKELEQKLSVQEKTGPSDLSKMKAEIEELKMQLESKEKDLAKVKENLAKKSQ